MTAAEKLPERTPIYNIAMNSLMGAPLAEDALKEKLVLVVNVASKCGFTKQYKELQQTYSEFSHRGFVVLGVPCNQFGAQESGSAGEIQSFCRLNFGVDFPLLHKQDVNGSDRSPLYDYLLKGRTPVLWNFEKVLVGKDGKVIDRFRSTTGPDSKKILTAIQSALGE